MELIEYINAQNCSAYFYIFISLVTFATSVPKFYAKSLIE